ncbi:hypothetical protein JXA12_01400 [Candidatus Woesearchaeota archaeon]|nr:hypothetical protein [Candidatus Woesearchaeota archaeon]
MTDEYELIPADELAHLRKEIDILKANPFGDSEHGKTLLESVEQLNGTINRLIKVFSDAETEMAREYDKVKTVDEQFADLQDQNKKIASGIIALAQMLRESESASHDEPPGEAAGEFSAPDLPVGEDSLARQPSVEQSSSAAPDEPPPAQPPPSSAFSTLPDEGSADLSLGEMDAPPLPPPQDRFAAGEPRPLPVDPWQPQQSPPVPGAPSPAPQPGAAPAPPQQPVTPDDSLGVPPPPPEKKKFGLFK